VLLQVYQQVLPDLLERDIIEPLILLLEVLTKHQHKAELKQVVQLRVRLNQHKVVEAVLLKQCNRLQVAVVQAEMPQDFLNS